MYSEVLTAGKHLIYDIQNIKNTSLLNNPAELKNVLLHICNKYNFTILNTVQHIFSPEGYSLIFLLSESHITIHTFPEKNYISFDMYTCREYTNNDVYNEIHVYLKDILDSSEKSPFIIIDRYFEIDVQNNIKS